jgi:hypothetical protein
MLRIFVIEYADGRKRRIKAARFLDRGGYGFCFYISDKINPSVEEADARVEQKGVISIIPQDMLVTSFEDSSILPEVLVTSETSTDYARDTLFSEAQKVPFSGAEREAIRLALGEVSTDIHKQFSTNRSQQEEIDSKLKYLEKKVKELDKFNWKRLLVTVLVGISVDLGFGTLIPAPLLNIFKEVFSQFIGRITRRTNETDPKLKP